MSEEARRQFDAARTPEFTARLRERMRQDGPLLARVSRRPPDFTFDATDDSSYTHTCGAVVQVPFSGTGVVFVCPRCGQTT